jgi:erythromycin esterase-like protein
LRALREVFMPTTAIENVAGLVRDAAIPITGAEADFDPLLERIGDARFVLIGEASHGTHEFYRTRAEITRRLIREKGFTAVAVEADWPDAYRVNRYVRGTGDDATAEEALRGFRRFPQWMWRNTEVVHFVEWLRRHNLSLPDGHTRAGFYGLDLYSLYTSIEAVVRYLDQVDPEAAARARERYACFEHAGQEPQAYGYMVDLGITPSCEEEAVRQLVELRERAAELVRLDGQLPEDEHFFAVQNARLVVDAERYYRHMFRGGVNTWNLRDEHMTDTLDALVQHFGAKGEPLKVVVWEHNSHLGDARATYMRRIGELNVGQLVRERHGDAARLVGFTTHTGTVTAATDWDGPAERKRVRSSLPGSYERLFHEVGIPRFLLPLHGADAELREAMAEERLERAIGVIYRPHTERQSHYFEARLSEQFDAVIHFDETRAREPLERTPRWESGEPEETYPTGL